MATDSIVPQQSPIVTSPAIEDCGICDVPHRCHCPRVKSWCDACPRPASRQTPEVEAGRLTARLETSRPDSGEDLSERRYVLTLKGLVAVTRYQRRLNLRTVS